ncbi:MAG: radical SAM protein [Acidobacteria bacterium]|nr:MAG: radical SAM protein [Acidobacteriota bacterium]
MRALLISTYDMGRQPFGLASPAAWLRAAGWDVVCLDLAKDQFDAGRIEGAALVGFHLPMHTATRLAGPIIARTRTLNPSARLCAYGVYAPLNEPWLRALGVDAVFGGEFESELTRWAGAAGLKVCATETTSDLKARATAVRADVKCATETNTGPKASATKTPSSQPIPVAQPFRAARVGRVPRIRFLVPDRATLPPLSQYATLQFPDGTRRLVGYTEASRGCRHRCRHCPIVPVYDGQFRIVQPEVVLADVNAQVAAGARHVTFGDPDFLNGPRHALRIVEALHAEHPGVSYDVTIKIEHLLQHRDLLPRLAGTGCAFVTSAVESVDDRVLALLDKGHTRADFLQAVTLTERAGLTLVPTFVAFHPWLTLEGYCDLLDTVEQLNLIDHVAPIQFAIRLLVPEGSRLLELEAMRRHIQRFDPATLSYRWVHPDPRVDALHGEVSAVVGAKLTVDRRAAFDAIRTLAHDRAGLPCRPRKPARDRSTVPYLNEPWYC